MITRDFYFLQDSVSKKFYTGQNNGMMDIRNAAVYYSEDAAKKSIKKIIRSWEHSMKYIDEFIKQTKGTDEEQRLVDEKKLGKQCKSLENWGIKIIKGTVNI